MCMCVCVCVVCEFESQYITTLPRCELKQKVYKKPPTLNFCLVFPIGCPEGLLLLALKVHIGHVYWNYELSFLIRHRDTAHIHIYIVNTKGKNTIIGISFSVLYS